MHWTDKSLLGLGVLSAICAALSAMAGLPASMTFLIIALLSFAGAAL
jgi:L-cysteine desulfidase